LNLCGAAVVAISSGGVCADPPDSLLILPPKGQQTESNLVANSQGIFAHGEHCSRPTGTIMTATLCQQRQVLHSWARPQSVSTIMGANLGQQELLDSSWTGPLAESLPAP